LNGIFSNFSENVFSAQVIVVRHLSSTPSWDQITHVHRYNDTTYNLMVLAGGVLCGTSAVPKKEKHKMPVIILGSMPVDGVMPVPTKSEALTRAKKIYDWRMANTKKCREAEVLASNVYTSLRQEHLKEEHGKFLGMPGQETPLWDVDLSMSRSIFLRSAVIVCALQLRIPYFLNCTCRVFYFLGFCAENLISSTGRSTRPKKASSTLTRPCVFCPWKT
jgi:hypothetical protein